VLVWNCTRGADLDLSEQTITQQGFKRIESRSENSIEFKGELNNDFSMIKLWHSNNAIDALAVLYPTSMRLGDAIAVIGSPSGVSSFSEAENLLSLAYPDRSLRMTIIRSNPSLYEQAIAGFMLTTPEFISPPLLTPWHGFVPKWRYCQLEPEFGYCQNSNISGNSLSRVVYRSAIEIVG
jgi:hypothetical protein